VKREELPATVDGFADPKWKGRLSIEATDNDWMYGVSSFMGEERGREFFQKLAALKPEMRKGHILVAQLLAAGELSVCLTIYSGNADSIKAKGGPIDWVAVEPLVGRPQAIALAANAPHPNAARLLMRWLMSPEGQELLVDNVNQYSARRDVTKTPLGQPPLSQLKINAFSNERIVNEGHALAVEFDKAVGM